MSRKMISERGLGLLTNAARAALERRMAAHRGLRLLFNAAPEVDDSEHGADEKAAPQEPARPLRTPLATPSRQQLMLTSALEGCARELSSPVIVPTQLPTYQPHFVHHPSPLRLTFVGAGASATLAAIAELIRVRNVATAHGHMDQIAKMLEGTLFTVTTSWGKVGGRYQSWMTQVCQRNSFYKNLIWGQKVRDYDPFMAEWLKQAFKLADNDPVRWEHHGALVDHFFNLAANDPNINLLDNMHFETVSADGSTLIMRHNDSPVEHSVTDEHGVWIAARDDRDVALVSEDGQAHIKPESAIDQLLMLDPHDWPDRLIVFGIGAVAAWIVEIANQFGKQVILLKREEDAPSQIERNRETDYRHVTIIRIDDELQYADRGDSIIIHGNTTSLYPFIGDFPSRIIDLEVKIQNGFVPVIHAAGFEHRVQQTPNPHIRFAGDLQCTANVPVGSQINYGKMATLAIRAARRAHHMPISLSDCRIPAGDSQDSKRQLAQLIKLCGLDDWEKNVRLLVDFTKVSRVGEHERDPEALADLFYARVKTVYGELTDAQSEQLDFVTETHRNLVRAERHGHTKSSR